VTMHRRPNLNLSVKEGRMRYKVHFRDNETIVEQSGEADAGGTTDLSDDEGRAIGVLMAEYSGGGAVETPVAGQSTDLSEQEDRGGAAKESYFGAENMRHFGADEMSKIAAQDDGSLPESVRADTELKEELLRQNHLEHFGEDDPNVSDAEMWGALSRTWGLEEK
jgi:hypothetical protein